MLRIGENLLFFVGYLLHPSQRMMTHLTAVGKTVVMVNGALARRWKEPSAFVPEVQIVTSFMFGRMHIKSKCVSSRLQLFTLRCVYILYALQAWRSNRNKTKIRRSLHQMRVIMIEGPVRNNLKLKLKLNYCVEVNPWRVVVTVKK